MPPICGDEDQASGDTSSVPGNVPGPAIPNLTEPRPPNPLPRDAPDGRAARATRLRARIRTQSRYGPGEAELGRWGSGQDDLPSSS